MGHLEIIRALIEHGVDVNDGGPSGKTALHKVVLSGRGELDLIDLLLSAGAYIDARKIEGCTPLHAAPCGYWEDCGGAAAILLHRGAAMDTIDMLGRSPLHIAAERDHLPATRALLAAGADSTLRCFSNQVPLHAAVQAGRAEVVRELLRHGVDFNASPDASNLTALHWAVFCKSVIVEALLEAGSSVTSQLPLRNQTPLHYTDTPRPRWCSCSTGPLSGGCRAMRSTDAATHRSTRRLVMAA
ncbi:unnamed protein product [Laminaria digitata]